MNRSAQRVLLLALLSLPGSGCRLAGRQGPVPEALATSRQLTQQGIAALEQGHNRRARKTLAEAVETCPVDPDARRHYAESLWRDGSQAEAVAHTAEASRLNPEDAMLQVRLAEMQLIAGQSEVALQTAEKALDLNPKLAAAWAVRARVMQAKNQPQRALSDSLRALSLAPEDRDLLLATAELYRHLNQPQRALATLHALADTYTPGEEPQRLLHLQGLAYVALGRYDDAVRAYRASVAREPASPELLCRLAEAELLAGQPDVASTTVHEALALQPGFPAGRRLLSQIRTTAERSATRR